MKKLSGAPFDQWRQRGAKILRLYGNIGDETCGAFCMPTPTGDAFLYVVASTGGGWDHVSVSLPTRCPTWEEMSAVKRAFFRRMEWAVELHPSQSENLSLHPYCLHLWRCQFAEMELPPALMVAPPSARSA